MLIGISISDNYSADTFRKIEGAIPPPPPPSLNLCGIKCQHEMTENP